MNLVLLVLNGSLIAAIYTLAKLGGAGGVSPLGLLAWQLLCAAGVLCVVAVATGRRPVLSRVTLRYALAAGVLGISAPNLLTFAALAHLPAGYVGVVGALSPAFTYAIALAWRIESLHALRLVGIALGGAGVLSMLLPAAGLPAHPGWALLALAGPLLLAAGNVFRTLAWPPGLHPIAAASLMLALQALLVVPVALVSGHFVAPALDGRPVDLALLGAGALTSAFYLSAFELQRRAGPVLVGQLGYVITAVSVLLGSLVFGERHGWPTAIAVALVFAGVALVHRAHPAGRSRLPGRLVAAEEAR